MKTKDHRKGFTLVEVLISLAFFMIIISSLYPLLGWLVTRSKSFENDVEAGLILQEGMESAYNVLIYNWDKVWTTYPMGDYHPAIVDNTDPTADNWILLPGEQLNLYAKYNRKVTVWPVCRDQDTGEYKKANSPDGSCPGTMLADSNSKNIETVVWWEEFGRPKTINTNMLITYLGE